MFKMLTGRKFEISFLSVGFPLSSGTARSVFAKIKENVVFFTKIDKFS